MLSRIPKEVQQYYSKIEEVLNREYAIALEAKKRMPSIYEEPEAVIAKDMAERVELLIGPPGIAEKIRELRKSFNGEKLAFKLAEEIISESRGFIDDEKLIKQALCTALAVLTPPCTTAAPTEGIVDVKIKSNLDGTKYLAVYFAGPIRSAGGTELAATIVLADYIRRIFNLDRYKPTEEEVMRFKEELRTYVRMVGNFQYNVPEYLLDIALRNMPIEVTGIATDRILAPSFRGLPRVETDYLRGGALRVMNDGVIGRARKVLKLIEMLGMDGWDWLYKIAEEYSKMLTSNSSEKSYIDETIGGRPIFSFPGSFGGFRLRYGRSFNTGMAAVGVHPMSMLVLEGYIATGTQLKLDYPGKGGVAMPVDSIEPPRVLLDDGSIVKIDSEEVYEEVKDRIKKVLFLGDILISYGDCLENNVELRPPGYCEEWWASELKLKILKVGGYEKASDLTGISIDRLESLVSNPLTIRPTDREAIRISLKLGVPLHPSYCWFWENISTDELFMLKDWINSSKRICKPIDGFVRIPQDPRIDRILTKLIMEHRRRDGFIELDLSTYRILLALLCQQNGVKENPSNALDAIHSISGITIRCKGGTFIGARMGRPEKAGPRKLSPPVHVLFPIGLKGGAKRDIVAATKSNGKILLEMARLECPSCGSISWKVFCENCKVKRVPIGICERCSTKYRKVNLKRCERCNGKISYTDKFLVDVKSELLDACKKLGFPPPSILKGVKALTSMVKLPEILMKGLLRAQLDLFVYKDGTIRYDMTNAPLTHFTPRQISVSVQKLRSLGYTHDIHGRPLTSEDQVCELMIQDIIIPRRAAEYFVKVSKFLDAILKDIAGMDPYYNCDKPEDLIGKFVAALSPHTYVAVIGRVIGITDSNVCLAHPIFHAAKRRDCDGDEDSLMLLLDVLINFSRLYLPDRIGGKMDSPLLIMPIAYPDEVDEQAHNLDVAYSYPLEFYEEASKGTHSSKLLNIVPTVKLKLSGSEAYRGFGFTHPTSKIVLSAESTYKRVHSMLEKIESQIRLTEKLSSVNIEKVVESIASSHIMPDITGNLKAFFIQSFRCKRCNAIYRRLPLSGRCRNCGSELIQTVFKGNIEKYVELAESILLKYISDVYLKESLRIAINNVKDTFIKDRASKLQVSLERFISNQ